MSETMLLDLSKVNMVYYVDVQKPWTMRDVFTRALSEPYRFFTRSKDQLHVLNDLSLQVSAGERIGLIGVNGVGKTTLCRVIAGMLKPTRGSVKIHGQVRAIFNTTVGIQPELTGRENAELVAQLMYPFEPQIKDLVEDALDFSELGKFLDVPFRLYSTGMQTRLCLSLVSARPADILILDEVFDGADAFFREKISKRVLSMVEKSGCVFFVSHAQEQLEKVCNRALVLDRGRIAFDGAPQDAFSHFLKRENHQTQ